MSKSPPEKVRVIGDKRFCRILQKQFAYEQFDDGSVAASDALLVYAQALSVDCALHSHHGGLVRLEHLLLDERNEPCSVLILGWGPPDQYQGFQYLIANGAFPYRSLPQLPAIDDFPQPLDEEHWLRLRDSALKRAARSKVTSLCEFLTDHHDYNQICDRHWNSSRRFVKFLLNNHGTITDLLKIPTLQSWPSEIQRSVEPTIVYLYSVGVLADGQSSLERLKKALDDYSNLAASFGRLPADAAVDTLPALRSILNSTLEAIERTEIELASLLAELKQKLMSWS